MKVAVIGGGAAGFFAAIAVKENHPSAEVTIYEKTKNTLSKVRISGGGRCNVTNGCSTIKQLADGYPRGAKKLKKAFKKFSNLDTQQWYIDRGVVLKTEADNRVFPVSDDSASIVNCLMSEIHRLGITLKLKTGIENMLAVDHKIVLDVSRSDLKVVADKVIIAVGGSPKRSGLDWLGQLGHKIIDPVPSLFTFNMPESNITDLMGVVAPNALVTIQGTKLKSNGSLLITHWGMSGPAILKLSSLAARNLSETHYQCTVQINWVNVSNHDLVTQELNNISEEHSKKYVANIRPFNLPDRLWTYILIKCNIPTDKPWAELGKKNINKLVTHLTNDCYDVKGKTTFKEEFVTCGGVSLESIDFNTMQSHIVPNLYFAGEVIDIDGITGGYNFQAAWTTAWIAGQLS